MVFVRIISGECQPDENSDLTWTVGIGIGIGVKGAS